MADTYWAAPEDLTMNWARLRAVFEKQAEGHPYHQITITVLAHRGLAQEVIESELRPIEPVKRTSKGEGNGNTWWSVIRRLRSVVPANGRVMVTSDVLLDSKCQPKYWTAPECKRVNGNGRK